MSDIIEAPFTIEQVEALNDWQQSGIVHPFTCGKRDDHKSEGILVATVEGWVCEEPGCDYTQGWAHDFMANPGYLERIDWRRGSASEGAEETP